MVSALTLLVSRSGRTGRVSSPRARAASAGPSSPNRVIASRGDSAPRLPFYDLLRKNITVHAVPRADAPRWLMQKHAEGYELDLKLWAGLWMIEHNPDGSRAGD